MTRLENSITQDEYHKAVEVIKKYKTQIESERKELLKKSLARYDRTYWFYKGSFKQIYISAIVEGTAYNINRFIIHTNGIIEIRSDHKNRDDLEYFLAEMGEYAPEEWELKEGKKNIFITITEQKFLHEIEVILSKLQISDSHDIQVNPKEQKSN